MRTLAIFAVALYAVAQTKFEYWPGVVYDPAIPTHKQVLGYDAGERISWHASLMRYMEALAQAAPTRIKLHEYAKSWEGRKLIYAVIGSESNLRRIDEIRAGVKKLADPRHTTEAEAKALIARLPAIVWLAYGVHGNEISSPDAALLTAYHLLAARKDKLVDEILAGAVVVIVPTQNPDGRDRFIHNFEQAEGIEPDPSPLAAEHNEPWPNGRTNHYFFDLNRDWFALTQPETRGHVKALREWLPQVFVDLHEMGSDSTYYFAPEAVPFNPHLTKEQKTSLDWFGRNNARWFDQYGFSYFTREVYDAFYPGYGASWPSYYGAIAMTYEQASARGLAMRRTDETVFHFRDTVRQHFVASISTAETAARERRQLLENFWRYRQTAIEEGSKEPVREFILPRRGDTSAVDKLASVLAEQGVEMKRAAASFANGGKQYPAGSYTIPLAQPAKRLVRTLLDANVPMEDTFLKEQERRRKRKLPDEIYDVTAWSLPLLYNVEAVPTGEASKGTFEDVQPGPVPGRVLGRQATVAYLVAWGTQAAGRFLTAALREGLRVASTEKPFTQGSMRFPRGTLIVKVKENAESVHAAVQKLAAQSGADVHATNTGWVEDGVNFGSRYVATMRRPTIALAWDRPVAGGPAGHTRYVIERQYGYPVTPVRTTAMAGAAANLSRFDVIILPDASPFDGGYAAVLGANGLRRIKDWVTAGGTLIGIGSAVAYMADPRVALLSAAQENAARAAAEQKKEAERKADETRVAGKLLKSEEDYTKSIQADSELPDEVAGVLVRARLDGDHWLTAGMGDMVYALVSGRSVFTPVKLDKGVNAALFAAPDQLLASGYLWDENRQQLAYKPMAIVERSGRGTVIGFTADPNYRAYMDGLNVMFLNAIFRGAAQSRPAP